MIIDGKKVCGKCRISKAECEFDRDCRSKDNRQCYCRLCKKINVLTPEGKLRRKKYQKEHNIELRKNVKRWESKPENKIKILAHTKLNNAVLLKKLERGSCQVCGEPRTDGHHPDYSKPFEVIWLCRFHHKALHKLSRTTATMV